MFGVKRVLLIAALAAAAAGYVTASRAASYSPPRCPAHAAKPSLGVKTRSFVRPNASALVLCRYANVNWGTSQGLLRSRRINLQSTIGGLTRSFNHLQEPPRGIFCVRDDGSEIALLFAYGSGHVERVTVRLTGCRFAMNGRDTRSTTTTLYNRLKKLTRNP